jgi:hypothetical protein
MTTTAERAPEIGEHYASGNDIDKKVAVSATSEDQNSGDEITNGNGQQRQTILQLDKKKSWLGYIKTKQFWIVLFFGYDNIQTLIHSTY